MASFSDLVRRPKAAPAEQPAAEQAPVAAPAPAAATLNFGGPTLAALQAALQAYGLRVVAAQKAGRIDARVERNIDALSSIADGIRRYGRYASEKQAVYARSLVEWSQDAPAAPAPVPGRPATWAAIQPFSKLQAGDLGFRKKNGHPLWWVTWRGDLVGKAEGGTVIGFTGKARSAGHDPEAIKAALDAFEADPLAALKAHGLATGSCGCCGRELTDPESIAFGIGPICRAKGGF